MLTTPLTISISKATLNTKQDGFITALLLFHVKHYLITVKLKEIMLFAVRPVPPHTYMSPSALI